MSSLHFTPITPAEAREVLTWRYPGLPTLYNPLPDELENDIEVLLTPAYNYFAARSAQGLLVGFCCYGSDAQVPGGDYSLRNAIDVGLGMNPQLSGRGLSHPFLAAILDWGRCCFVPDFFRATVAAINGRSPVSYTHLRAHETVLDLVCRLLLEKKKNNHTYNFIRVTQELPNQ